jgi:hypothetical protein
MRIYTGLGQSPTSSLRDDGVRVRLLNALKFLQWEGARMVEEVGDLALGDRLPEGKLQEPFYVVRMRE